MTANDDILQEVENSCKAGKWSEVHKKYEKNSELRTAKKTGTGDTVLHMVISQGKVSRGKEKVVESIVDSVCRKGRKEDDYGGMPELEEKGDEEKLVLGAQDSKGNTPLHLAATRGSAKMCKKIGDKYPAFLIAKRNNDGQTPLFLAALHEDRKVFLTLHYMYMRSPGPSSPDIAHCIRSDDGHNILFCAMEKGRIANAPKEILNKLKKDADNGNWQEVVKTCKKNEGLRTAYITKMKDTVLHKAVSDGSDWAVGEIVNLLVNDEKDQDNEKVMESGESEKSSNVNDVLGAKNEKGNTPLHLAASYKGKAYYDSSKGIKMSTMIVDKYPSLVVEPNKAGETPLFMAALHGNREVFLYLYYKIPPGSSNRDAHYKKGDSGIINDTILHCAIAGGHIDVAIEIVLLYKDHMNEMATMRNKNGLYPLHILAAIPSAFASTDLDGRSFIVKLLYHCFEVNRKDQATEEKDIFKESRYEPCLLPIMIFPLCCCLYCADASNSSWVRKILTLIVYLLWVLPLFLLLPLIILELLFLLAGNWLLEIRKLKEKHTWSLQISEQLHLLHHSSCGDNSEKQSEVDGEAGSKTVVGTSLMIATENGIIKMVDNVLKSCSSTKEVLNEGKNIILLATKKSQTKLYQFLCAHEKVSESEFSKVDKDGNTALHLAAKRGDHLNWQTTTMFEEFKWFKFVKNSLPSDELREKYNEEGKSGEEIFKDSYKEHMKSDREWLNKISEASSVVSTLIAGNSFSNVAGNFDGNNYSSLVALSLFLTSTISFLGILAFRSQSLNFWRYVPFMLHFAIFAMFCSIVALWISLLLHHHSLTAYVILGLSIVILTILSLPIFIGPTLMSMFTKVPHPSRNTTSAIRYLTLQKKENEADPKQGTNPKPGIDPKSGTDPKPGTDLKPGN